MKRILLVDDDADTLSCMSMVLSASYDTVSVGSGVEAVFAVSTQSFDAIVLDYMMPIVDGTAVIEELRARGVGTPVLLASASMEIAETAKRLGVADYVTKPFSIAQLEEKLGRILGDTKQTRVRV